MKNKIKYKRKTISLSEYRKEVDSRGDIKEIKFRCPVCGNSQSVNDFIKIGVDNDTSEGVFYFSCIGRFVGAKSMDEKPCNYTSGGLFKLNNLFVQEENGNETGVFDFAENPLCEVDNG